MPNRFTAALDAIVPMGKNDIYERLDWTDLYKISDKLSRLAESMPDYDCTVEFSQRNLLFAFVAEMSDEDLCEVFGIELERQL